MVVKKNCRAADSMRQGVFGRERIRRILFVFLAAFFCQIGLHEIYEEGNLKDCMRIQFRQQRFGDSM